MPAVSIALRRPEPSAERLLAGFVPPQHFANATFETYLPDPAVPSQAAAVTELQAFGAALTAKRGLLRRAPQTLHGRYLDGGFGVGKTHLLAALWHSVEVPKFFGTFVGFTNLVGALGFQRCVTELSKARLVCIDEFELDDPGDTVLMSTLLARLVENGVWLAATSNTLPDRLGEERFATEDFLREIQGLAAHFETVRVDGDDYRHRGLPDAPTPASREQVVAVASSDTPAIGTCALNEFVEISSLLAAVHPSRYAMLLEGIDAFALQGVQTLTDQATALRWVVLADRLYDADIPVIYSGTPLDELFAPELLAGGYRKKYRRAVSRLVALSRSGEKLLHE